MVDQLPRHERELDEHREAIRSRIEQDGPAESKGDGKGDG
jgi:hypothetical protein